MKRDRPERLLFGREYHYASTFIFDRAFDHGTHDLEDLQEFARSLAQPGNTRGGLEWYRAFRTNRLRHQPGQPESTRYSVKATSRRLTKVDRFRT
jgi:hypothetical protein